MSASRTDRDRDVLHSYRRARLISRRADILVSRRRSTLSVVALIGLLSLVQLQAAAGACGSFLRAVTVSWDNPTTQVVDELASQSVPYADPARQIREQVVQARRAETRLVLPAETGRAGSPGVDTGVTRSPPLV